MRAETSTSKKIRLQVGLQMKKTPIETPLRIRRRAPTDPFWPLSPRISESLPYDDVACPRSSRCRSGPSESDTQDVRWGTQAVAGSVRCSSGRLAREGREPPFSVLSANIADSSFDAGRGRWARHRSVVQFAALIVRSAGFNDALPLALTARRWLSVGKKIAPRRNSRKLP